MRAWRYAPHFGRADKMTGRIITPSGKAAAAGILDGFFAENTRFRESRADFDKLFRVLVGSFRRGGTLFLCGSGGSYADTLHIAGELMKRFESRRPIPDGHRDALLEDPDGRALADTLESGLRAIALGSNAALASAILNDQKVPDLHFAQELYVLGRKGDVVMGISTSGNSRGVIRAFAVARILGIRTVGLTGPGGGEVAKQAEAVIRAPGDSVYEVQQSHLALYHTLCRAVEAVFFPSLPAKNSAAPNR
jgi:D-sedoheptulose 7-phosphate isomerase